MSRLRALFTVCILGFAAACAASQKMSSDSRSAAHCIVALKVENNTESALNVYWTALDRSGPSILVGRAPRGKSTIPLSQAVIAQMKNGPNHFYSRRLSDAGYVDEQKLTYQRTCE
jgi:hypothetical protein